jgi:DNA-binding NtrC family response regulator
MTRKTNPRATSETDSRPGEGGAFAFAAAACELVVVHSPDRSLVDQRVAIDRPLELGRSSRSGERAPGILAIDDRRISRRHASIRRRADGAGLELENLASKNGSFVDGRRCDSARVEPGSVLRVGDTLIVVDAAAKPQTAPEDVIGASAAFTAARAALDDALRSTLPVLLLGETGTGKEVFARELHASWRSVASRPGDFLVMDCAAIPKDLIESYLFGHVKGAFTGATGDAAGYFAQASGGTLFLDEIGDLPFHLQAKLLRVIETQEFSPVGSTRVQRSDARIVSATSADLVRDVATGVFRRDLYARLAGFVVRLPSLRQRRSDIMLLARRFYAGFAGHPLDASADLVERLLLHDWPMNVRELRMVMNRLAVKAGADRVHDVADVELDPGLGREPMVDEPATAAPPRAELAALLRRFQGNVSEVATHYGRHRKQIYRWLERCELDPRDFKL